MCCFSSKICNKYENQGYEPSLVDSESVIDDEYEDPILIALSCLWKCLKDFLYIITNCCNKDQNAYAVLK
ncbi:MAG: hypothetical protein WDZ28_01735 [Simkaniaceae bacterium]